MSTFPAQPNAFYWELIERGEVENAERYLKYLRGEITVKGRRYVVDHFRLTRLKQSILSLILNLPQPVLVEDITANIHSSKRRVVLVALESLVSYGFVDELYGAYSLTEKGASVEVEKTDDRIYQLLRKSSAAYTVSDIVKALNIDRVSTVRPAIRKLLEEGKITRVKRGLFVSLIQCMNKSDGST